MPRPRLVPFIAAGLIALAACGSSGSATGDTIPPGALRITAEDGLQWDSAAYQATAVDGVVTIAAGNKSSIAHDLWVISTDGTKNPTHIDLKKKKTVVKQFRLAPGTYQVVCLVPGHDKMKSALTVS